MEVIIDGVRYAPVVEKKEEKKEPIKLYCVKNDGCGFATKGKVYEFIDGDIRLDSAGYSKGLFDDYADFVKHNPSIAACLFPLVSRKAKIGETVYMLRDDCFGINKKGTITKCVGDDYVYDKTGQYTSPGISVLPQSEHYLVIDGYQPEPERCKCCGQVIGE